MVATGVTTPAEFSRVLKQCRQQSCLASGHLSDSEKEMLTLLASCPTAIGDVLEIGSYKGLSTVLLATALGFTNAPRMHACDPWAAPGVTGQDLKTDDSTFAEFQNALARANVREQVVVHRQFSHDLARTWNTPLRLLWIDGDHSLKGAESDYELWSRHVVPGGIIAFHDVLHAVPGPATVFATKVLSSDEWGACGICGSIGWAQRAIEPEDAVAARPTKQVLYDRLIKLVRHRSFRGNSGVITKVQFKLLRHRVPHATPTFQAFCSQVRYRAA